MLRTVALVGLSFAVLLQEPGASPAATPAPAQTTYEVYALSYGVYPGFPVSALVAGAEKGRKADLQMMFWLFKGADGRNILVDAGCYREKLVKENGLQSFVKPSEVVSKVGLTPADITDVIVSHMHWDHVDGVDLFPRAQVWIQKDEYAYYTGAAWQPGGKSGGIEPDDVLAMVKINLEHRLHLVEGDDQEIYPGIRVYTGGRHTFASQYVGVRTASGTVVIASDNVYLYENLRRHAPIAQTFDADSNLKAQDRMKQIATAPDGIVPGHDPEVGSRFPTPGNGVARIQPAAQPPPP